ncbi:MAG: hypothetical protein E6Q24_00245 [Chitinophagaceae bacterium]|nr:MAG: hypothetical protein E6Q24_00245 [Chitinophagaceae bacterium]
MRKTGSLLTGLLILSALSSFSQITPVVQPATPAPAAAGMYPNTGMATEDEFNRRGRLYNTAYYVMVDGQKVMGTYFWDPEWLEGSLITGDNRLVNVYKFKYDSYHQSVFFLTEKDSLEVDEEVKEFTLRQPTGDSVKSFRFINSNQYKKGEKANYYQLLVDKDKGQLLKLNQKKVTDLSEGIAVNEGKKYFEETAQYFYYNKEKKKLIKLKLTETAVQSALGLDEKQAQDIQGHNGNMAIEKDLISFVEEALSKK